MVYVSPLDGGYTRARVVSVVVKEINGPVRKCVLKAIPAGERGSQEGDVHAAALASGPSGFVAAHLVEQPYPPIVTDAGGVLMFQAVAGGDMSAYRPLATIYDNATLPIVAGQIVRSLIEDWDPDPLVETMTARACVRTQLGRRGAPGGPLERWAAGAVGSDWKAPWLRFEPGEPALPNPLVWLRDDDNSDAEVIVHLGRAHGDLHLDNIFIRFAPLADAASYQLIDLSEWSAEAPLCRDIPHLLLATIGKHLAEIPTGHRRYLAARIIDAASGVATGPGSLRHHGFEVLTDKLLAAGDDWAGRQDMLDDWRVEQLLGVVAAALIQASVSVHQPGIRWWFLELAAAALARHLAGSVDAPPEKEIPLVGSAAGHGVDIAAIAERLDECVGGFSRRKGTVLIVSEDGMDDASAISRQPWDLVVEFDPGTDHTGAYAQKPDHRDHRLITFEQEASFSPHTTVWLAAAGIEGGRVAAQDLRSWRSECLPGIRSAIAAFATSSARPVVVCTAGKLGGRARAVVETLLDHLTTRAELMALAEDGAPELADYSPEVLAGDPADVLRALPDRTVSDETTRAITIPGRREEVTVPVEIDEKDLAWISKSGTLLHSELGRTAERETAIGEGFYRGETISWLELDIGADVPRDITERLLRTINADLQSRDSRRIAFHHYPGAGGTTASRRIAWDLHHDYPVLMVEQANDSDALADRLRRIHAVTNSPTLVVLESTLSAVIDRTYSAIRADSLPCVFLIVERRAEEPSTEAGERTFYLGPLNTAERNAFVAVFGKQVPERHPYLTRLAASAGSEVVPFLFGLTTYEADYTGLHAYVKRSLDALTTRDRDALKIISLVHHYAGMALPSVLLAGIFEVPDEKDVELAPLGTTNLTTLLIESQPEYWRTMHDLIARESLAQLLTPGTDANRGSADWKAALSTLSIELIRQSAEEFGSLIPVQVRAIIDQLFIVRNNTAVFAGGQQLFSELLNDMPSAEGRIEVLRTLAESFPGVAHFWAHLGRMLSYFARDHPAALRAIDTALNLESEDDVLYHMKGIILRNKMRTEMENREHLTPRALRKRVLDDVSEAREQFERSVELNDESEYGHVSLVQLCIDAIEFGRKQSSASSYSAFLSAPDSAYYRDLMSLAEESLERIREIRGGDRPSRYAAIAEAKLQAFYDDYAALLQGWRNLLDRQDLAKPPIRRQLVRAYRRRAGSWREANGEHRARAIELLEENLRDDPSDTGSLMEWLRVARFRSASLDRAAELIHYSLRDPATAPREVVFYDYVATALLAIGGRDTAAIEYRRKVERSRERAASFSNRRFGYEWYTGGNGLAQLVHHWDLREWDRSAGGDDPGLLTRVEGRVHKISRPAAGDIDFGPGLSAFFSPGAAQLVADRHTNARVSFLLGFSYDGPRAWSVRLLDG